MDSDTTEIILMLSKNDYTRRDYARQGDWYFKAGNDDINGCPVIRFVCTSQVDLEALLPWFVKNFSMWHGDLDIVQQVITMGNTYDTGTVPHWSPMWVLDMLIYAQMKGTSGIQAGLIHQYFELMVTDEVS